MTPNGRDACHRCAGSLTDGTHVLVWRVVSEDGHPVGGSLVFSLGAPSAGGQPEADAPADRAVQAALWLGKVVLYVGLFFGVGGAFFLAWIGSASDPAARHSSSARFASG